LGSEPLIELLDRITQTSASATSMATPIVSPKNRAPVEILSQDRSSHETPARSMRSAVSRAQRWPAFTPSSKNVAISYPREQLTCKAHVALGHRRAATRNCLSPTRQRPPGQRDNVQLSSKMGCLRHEATGARSEHSKSHRCLKQFSSPKFSQDSGVMLLKFAERRAGSGPKVPP